MIIIDNRGIIRFIATSNWLFIKGKWRKMVSINVV